MFLTMDIIKTRDELINRYKAKGYRTADVHDDMFVVIAKEPKYMNARVRIKELRGYYSVRFTLCDDSAMFIFKAWSPFIIGDTSYHLKESILALEMPIYDNPLSYHEWDFKSENELFDTMVEMTDSYLS